MVSDVQEKCKGNFRSNLTLSFQEDRREREREYIYREIDTEEEAKREKERNKSKRGSQICRGKERYTEKETKIKK